MRGLSSIPYGCTSLSPMIRSRSGSKLEGNNKEEKGKCACSSLAAHKQQRAGGGALCGGLSDTHAASILFCLPGPLSSKSTTGSRGCILE